MSASLSATVGSNRKNWIATSVITAISVVAVSAAWATAPIRNAELSPATQQYQAQAAPTTIPADLTPSWTGPADAFNTKPIIADGVVITADTSGSTGAKTVITGVNPSTGQALWTYSRDEELCSLGQAWKKAVVDFRTGVGCGDVVAIDAQKGTYARTRSAIASDNPVPISSNDRVGIVGEDRVELWRNDLVRTVEYGDVEAKQEAGYQPNEDCTIRSALTRKELLAVVEQCGNVSWLRMLKATPEDSRKPEIIGETVLASPEGQVVAISQNGAAVYAASASGTTLNVYNDAGTLTTSQDVDPAPIVSNHEGVFGPATADMPHHMSWFDGKRLLLLRPDTLAVERVIDGALGTGTVVADRLLVPVAEGIAVYNWQTGETESTIAIDRAGYSGPIGLGLAGATVIEKRGEQLVALQPA